MTATGQALESIKQLFLQNLQVVDRIIAIIARRNAIASSDAEEFAAWARARLTDDHYSILRKFGGRSSLKTYLSVVLSNLFRDYRNSVWGRWRPSAVAARLGPIGIRLEELVVRDGCPVREAVAILRSAGATESEADLARLCALLPARLLNKEVALDELADTLAGQARLVSSVDESRERIQLTLHKCLAELGDEDRVITRMRFWDATSVADIAKALRLDQKPLYRRIEAIQQRLKQSLAQHGVTEEQARDVLVEEGLW